MSEVQWKREGRRGLSRLLPRRLLISLCGVVLAASPAAGQSTVLDAMKAELDRSMELLGEEETPPYFLSYEISESRSVSVGASFGALTNSDESHERLLDIDLRVGDYSLDNTRPSATPSARSPSFEPAAPGFPSTTTRQRFGASCGARPTSSTNAPWNSSPR